MAVCEPGRLGLGGGLTCAQEKRGEGDAPERPHVWLWTHVLFGEGGGGGGRGSRRMNSPQQKAAQLRTRFIPSEQFSI